jgi:hypothetical protein
MAVSTTNAISGPYATNGATVSFPFTFTAPSASEVEVVLRDANGEVATVSSGSYEVDLSAAGGGSVDFDVAPVTGYDLYVLLAPEFTQDIEFENGSAWLAEPVNEANDRAAARDQFLKARLDLLAPQYILTAAAAGDTAGKFLAWDAEGNPGFSSGTGADEGLREDLTAPGGSAIPGFTQTGVGAVVRTVQAKLREFLSRADYSSDGNFNTAKAASPNSPSLDGDGNFGAKVTPTGEGSQLALASAVLSVAQGPRDPVVYHGSQTLSFYRNFATMGGFRFRGHYTRGRAPTFPMPASKVASLNSGLGAESAIKRDSWYAFFACANDGDAAAVIKAMPYLRAGTVAGNNVPLIKAGEAIHALTSTTYSWSSADNLAGTECLVISENGFWSGRVTTITANSTSQVTLASAGTLAAYDFLLPAPPGYDHYVYLGSCYYEYDSGVDIEAIRNIYDSGTYVGAYMVDILKDKAGTTGFTAGEEATPVEIDARGYICPLATAAVLSLSSVISTTSTGDFGEQIGGDTGSHFVAQRYIKKSDAAATLSVVNDGIIAPFLYPQTFAYSNSGTLATNRTSGTMRVLGWIEP